MSAATSSLAPSDSVSQTAPSSSTPSKKKRSRPGPAERKGLKKSDSSVVPTPGKYPVVFATGTGEATADSEVALAPRRVGEALLPFAPALSLTPRFVEFAANARLDESSFQWWCCVSGLLYIAQRLLWSHEHMGLPRGDFGPVGSTDIKILRSMATALSQVGEMRVDELCQRFILADHPSTIRALIRCAHRLTNTMSEARALEVISEMWLPSGPEDGHFSFLVARAVSDRLRLIENMSLAVPVKELADQLNEGTGVPDWFEAVKPLLGNNPDRFDFLFDAFGTEQEFLDMYGSAANRPALEELGLYWAHPARNHLGWSLNHKQVFTTQADRLLRPIPAMQKFFSLVSTQTLKAEARGSRSQLAFCETVRGVTVIRSRLALTAPELSLFVCFPLELIVETLDQYPTSASTTVPVSTRRIEFIQLDTL